MGPVAPATALAVPFMACIMAGVMTAPEPGATATLGGFNAFGAATEVEPDAAAATFPPLVPTTGTAGAGIPVAGVEATPGPPAAPGALTGSPMAGPPGAPATDPFPGNRVPPTEAPPAAPGAAAAGVGFARFSALGVATIGGPPG